MRVALFQYAFEPTPAGNLDKITSAVHDAAAQRADLLVLPEVCLTGFGAGPNALACTAESPETLRFIDLARSSNVRILAGLRWREGGEVRNRAVLFGSKGIEQYYDKRFLFHYWNEHLSVGAGNRCVRFNLGDWSIAPLICFELRFPELFREVVGTYLFPIVANWPESRRDHWLTLLRARAIENQAYVVGVNRLGNSGDVRFSGDSIVVSPKGEVILDLGTQERCIAIDLDLAALLSYRTEFPILPSV